MWKRAFPEISPRVLRNILATFRPGKETIGSPYLQKELKCPAHTDSINTS